MTAVLPSSRPIRPSLFSAAKSLDAASDGHWPEEREALRGGVSAIEYHLDTLARVRRRSIEARLQARAIEIEQRLHEVLIRARSVQVALAAGTTSAAALKVLATAIMEIANEETDLILEQIRT